MATPREVPESPLSRGLNQWGAYQRASFYGVAAGAGQLCHRSARLALFQDGNDLGFLQPAFLHAAPLGRVSKL